MYFLFLCKGTHCPAVRMLIEERSVRRCSKGCILKLMFVAYKNVLDETD